MGLDQIVKVGPTADDLSEGLQGYNLDFPGSALSPGCTYADWARQIAKTSPPAVYAHIATQADAPGKLSLQYWFFYIFNDWNNKHEGDWEMVQLDFHASTESKLSRPRRTRWATASTRVPNVPPGATISSRSSTAPTRSSIRRWALTPTTTTRASIWAAAPLEGVGCDDTVGPSQTIRPDVVVVPQTDYLGQFPWLGYLGRWGERQRAFYNGPTGPKTRAGGPHRSRGPTTRGETTATRSLTATSSGARRRASSARRSAPAQACSRPSSVTHRRA